MNAHIFTWQHIHPNGSLIGEIRRFSHPDGSKSDIPYYHFSGTHFTSGIPNEMKKTGYPLFGLESILDLTKPLIICEGQKAQNAFAGLGFQCVTSILGAHNAHQSDWNYIKKANLIYLAPDNDNNGEKYIESIYKILSEVSTKIIRLPNLPQKGDICDWLKQQPELLQWNELDSLQNHPSYQMIQNRLHTTINNSLQDIPDTWKASDWPEPESIQNYLLPVEPLSDYLIPEPFRDWITDVTERMQCPKDYIAVTAIITVASIVGAGCGIKPKKMDDWLVIPNLWGGVIGRPGMLKTPAVSEVLQIISQLEAISKKNFDSKLGSYQAELEFYKSEREALKSAMLNSSKQALKNKAANENYDSLSLKDKFLHLSEPKKPIWKRYKTNDTTIEKLSELLAENPRGLLLYRDELIGLLASWEQDGRESDRAFFLEAWNGYGSLTTDRIGRGTIHAENLCVSIFGNTQPTKLIHYLYHAIRGLGNDGLLQRFQLLIYPDEPNNWKLVDRKPNQPAKERAINIIENLAAMDFIQAGAKKNSDDRFPYFHFNDEAQQLFYQWLIELEKEKLRQDDFPILIEHLAKYRSLMPSLALLFHLIDAADGKFSQKISYQTAALAIEWCKYLEKHARRIYGIATNSVRESTLKLSKKILHGELPSPFSLRDIYRKQWALLDEKETVLKACEELIDFGWLRAELPTYEIGRPKLPVYLINPKLSDKEIP